MSSVHPDHQLILEQPGAAEEADDVNEPNATTELLRVPQCKACHKTLYDLRYQCNECPDANFCSRCRIHHPYHRLTPVTGPYDPGSDDSDEDVEESEVYEDGRDRERPAASIERDGDDMLHSEDAASGRAGDCDDGMGDLADIVESDSGAANSSTTWQTQPPPRQKRSRPAYIRISHEDCANLTEAMDSVKQSIQVMASVIEQIFRPQTSKFPSAPTGSKASTAEAPRASKTLMRFPVDLAMATLDSDEDQVDESVADLASDIGVGSNFRAGSRHQSTPTHRGRGLPRHWTASERRKLHRMKERGWGDERIGAVLGRTAGAVSQQWRKQK